MYTVNHLAPNFSEHGTYAASGLVPRKDRAIDILTYSDKLESFNPYPDRRADIAELSQDHVERVSQDLTVNDQHRSL